jgi:hypothetical protein
MINKIEKETVQQVRDVWIEHFLDKIVCPKCKNKMLLIWQPGAYVYDVPTNNYAYFCGDCFPPTFVWIDGITKKRSVD